MCYDKGINIIKDRLKAIDLYETAKLLGYNTTLELIPLLLEGDNANKAKVFKHINPTQENNS